MPRWTPQQIKAFWRVGCLAYKLDALQVAAYRDIRRRMGRPFARYVLNWARRTGKTWLLLVIAIEVALRRPRARINVAAATKESLREFIWPIVDSLIQDCPPASRPRLVEAKGRIIFQNGSRIVLASCDNRRAVERLRGPKADLNVIEEGGAIPDDPGLNYVMTSILNPQLLTTGGATLLATTPPKSPGHAAVKYAMTAKGNGNYSHATLWDNPRLTPGLKDAYLLADAEALGMTVQEYKLSVDYRREWMAEFLTDVDTAVLPGFDESAELETVQPQLSHILFADRYVSIDLGWSPDFTGVLFGYWDFGRQVLVIQHEILVRRTSPMDLAKLIRQAEERIWGRHDVFLRIADMPDVLFHDFSTAYGLDIVKTDKDNRDAAIAATDVWVRQRKLQVVPYDEQTKLGCRQLQVQMRLATHNKHRTDFDRTSEHGHFDLVAALVYLVRNVRPNQNKVPRGWGINSDSSLYNQEEPETDDTIASFRTAIGED